MNFEDFKKEVTDRIKDFLPEKYADAKVSITSVIKNNDKKLDGLMIKLEDSNIAPNIYLEDFYKEHENGRSMEDILGKIAAIREKYDRPQNFDVKKITDFDTVKDRIICRLVNAEQNAEYLKDKPHKMIDDLAVTYHVAIGREDGATMSAPITERMMEAYGIDVDQLHKIAVENIDNLSSVNFKSLSDTVIDMMLPEMMRDGMSEEEAKVMIKSMVPPTPENNVYVLTNEDKLHGAAMILSDKVMDDVTEKIGQDFYILPSSLHEVLIVPKTEEVDLRTLENMVRDVNASQVEPEDRLSDHVYDYDAKEHELFRADKAEERAAAKESKVSKEEVRAEKKERPSLRERLSQKKEIVAKNAANREPNQIKKDRGQALA
ncbi:MAG: DUF5688 family protein [Lachnospiraceae bacterium]|nr:DUF5688 family protein [Lachnospiraceae bacterium]